MNRIRKINNNLYQVLITPNYTTNPSIELLLGYILDENIVKFSIKQFDNLNDALALSLSYPDLDWNKLISMHKDIFYQLNNTIKQNLNYHKFIYDYKSNILTPLQLKNLIFNRVLKQGKRFTEFYNFNDIITFDIINPYTNNLLQIKNVLKNISKLNIIKIIQTNTHIKLIGQTQNNTLYEIRLWNTLMYDYIYWLYLNQLNQNDYINKINLIKQNIKYLDLNHKY